MSTTDKFFILPAGSVKLQGRLGKALRSTLENRLKKVDYDKLAASFRDHDDTDGKWRGEFWGKIVRSAIRVLQTTPDGELTKMIRKTVSNLCKYAYPDGALSTYTEDMRCWNWDVWGRKYALLGLARYYRMIEQSTEVKEVIRKHVKALLAENPFAERPTQGRLWHDGLATFSILGGFVIAWRITGEKEFLDAAEKLALKGCHYGGTMLNDFKSGKRPANLVNGKAYDRLGIESETEEILGVRLPAVTIPVTPGRNLAVILELAAMNNRQKKLGYNAAEMLAAEHDHAIDHGRF